jgi:hypothetical protein
VVREGLQIGNWRGVVIDYEDENENEDEDD